MSSQDGVVGSSLAEKRAEAIEVANDIDRVGYHVELSVVTDTLNERTARSGLDDYLAIVTIDNGILGRRHGMPGVWRMLLLGMYSWIIGKVRNCLVWQVVTSVEHSLKRSLIVRTMSTSRT